MGVPKTIPVVALTGGRTTGNASLHLVAHRTPIYKLPMALGPSNYVEDIAGLDASNVIRLVIGGHHGNFDTDDGREELVRVVVILVKVEEKGVVKSEWKLGYLVANPSDFNDYAFDFEFWTEALPGTKPATENTL